MKTKLKLLTAALGLAAATSGRAQTILISESFETDGLGTRYTAPDSFSNSNEDHWARTDGTWNGTSNINTYQGPGGYSNIDGSWFWAGEDMDDDSGTLPFALTFNTVDVSGYDEITFSGLFGYAGVVDNDWDDADYVYMQYNLDGSGWTDVLNFESTGTGFNNDMGHDANFDGIGETVLTYELASFSNTITGVSATNMDVRILASADAGDEAFAFDNISVTAIPEPSSIIMMGLVGLAAFGILRGRKK